MSLLRNWRRPICLEQTGGGRLCGAPASYVYFDHGVAPGFPLCANSRRCIRSKG